jgi:hypothetical protein
MRLFKLTGPAVVALLAFGAFAAFAASGAYAVEKEEENNPRILCLVEGCNALEGSLKGGIGRLEDLSGKSLEWNASEVKLKGCQGLAGNKDVNLCVDVPIHLIGMKKEKVACRSENAKGEKDPVETILALLDLHLAAELHLNAKGETVLLSLLIAKVLGTALEEVLTMNCGGVKTTLKGTVGCLLEPGLENVPIINGIDIVCELNKVTHDPLTGSCNVLCEDLGKIGLVSTFNGKTEVDTWLEVKLGGILNEDIFMDD